MLNFLKDKIKPDVFSLKLIITDKSKSFIYAYKIYNFLSKNSLY